MLRGVLVREVQQTTIAIPKIVVQRVVHHHADKAAHHDRRIDLDKRSVALAFTNVAAEKVVNVPHDPIEEHLGELVFLERGIKQQPLKLRIMFVMVERAECE